MTIKLRTWMLALSTALLLQWCAMAYVSVFDKPVVVGDEGEQGIEISLNMLAVPTAEPEKTIEELGEEPILEKASVLPAPIQKVEPVMNSLNNEKSEAKPTPVEQKTDVLVKQEISQSSPTQAEQIDQPQPLVAQPKPIRTTPSDTTSMQPVVKQQTAEVESMPKQDLARDKALQQTYFTELATMLAMHKRYPVSSRRKGEEGVVKLYFVVDRAGSVLDFRIAESSGFKKLDEAVLRMLKKAQPLPAFPQDMDHSTLEVNVPIVFQLNS
jgi:protein TonB